MKRTSEMVPLAHEGVPVEGCVVRVEGVGGVGDAEDAEDAEAEEGGGGESIAESRVAEAQQLTKPIGNFGGVRVAVDVETTGKTGVEMEALTGVVGAALTVVDMCKSVDKACVIEGVRVVGKMGGRSGGWGVWGEGGG